MRDEDRVAYERADLAQHGWIGEWLVSNPYGEAQRRYRKGCSCGHAQYCGPGCGGHTE